jgi:hypothetical protein
MPTSILLLILLSAPTQAQPEFPKSPEAPTSRALAPSHQEDPKTTIVTVRGLGLTSSDAREDAQTAALYSAVGALVDSEIRISKDKILEEIISASAGFIEKFEVIEEKKLKNGLFQIRARVTVRTNLLKKRLVEEKVITAKVDGGSLFAKAMSKKNNAQSANAIIAKNLADYPLNAINVSLAGEPEVLSSDGEMWRVGIPIQIALDQEQWLKSANLLRQALSVLASEKDTWNWSQDQRQPGAVTKRTLLKYAWHLSVSPEDKWMYGKYPNSDGYDFPTPPPDKIWAVVPKTSALSSALDAFLVPRSILVEFARFSARSITLVVEFVGADKEILATDTVYLDTIPTSGSPDSWHLRTLPRNSQWLISSTKERNKEWQSHHRDLSHRGALFFPNWLKYEYTGAVWTDSNPSRSYPQSLQLHFAPLVASKSLAATHEIRLRLESREQTFNLSYAPHLRSAARTTVTLKARDKKD